MREVALGVDIGGTNTKMALVDECGEILEFQHFKTRPDVFTYRDFLAELSNQVKLILKKISSQQKFLGIGLGAPNGNGATGEIVDPPNIPWGHVPFIKDLQTILDVKDLSCLLENDANCAAIAEGLFGLAKGCDDYIVVTLGTGVGTGVVCEGKLLHGATGMAGEGGHSTVVIGGRRCGCGALGHLEAYLGAKGLVMSAQELNLDVQSAEDLPRLALLAGQGDILALKLFQQSAAYLGVAISNMMAVTLPRLIILTGGVANAGEFFRALVEEEIRKAIFPPFLPTLRGVVHSQLPSEEGAVLGAASLIFHQRKKGW